MNLLKKLSDKNHLLHSAIKIISESEIKTFKGKTVVVYSENSNKSFLETLAREMVFNTLLNEEKEHYDIEKVIGENDKRFDAMAIVDNHITNIIECKNINCNEGKVDHNTIEHIVNNTKNQLLDKYLKDNIEKPIFVSIIITDIHHIINFPKDYHSFCETNEFYKNDLYDSLKKYGIAIITFKYIPETKTLEYAGNNIQRHAIVEKITNKQLNRKNMPFQDENMAEFGSKIINIIKFPTSGYKSTSVENVRDIKPATDEDKNVLIMKILVDLIKNYKINPNDIFCMFEYGHHKYFQYISGDTIIKENNSKDRAVICTLDGALIDGQNSVDCFAVIIKSIKKDIMREDLDDAESKIMGLIKQNLSDSQLQEFRMFIENLYIRVSITSLPNQDVAVHSAVIKNTSMKVKDEELIFPMVSGAVKHFSKILINKDIMLLYPKKKTLSNFNTSSFYQLNFNKLIKLLYLDFDLNKDKNYLLKLATELSSGLKIKNETVILNTMKQDGVSGDNKDVLADIDRKISEVNAKLGFIKAYDLDKEKAEKATQDLTNDLKHLNMEKQRCYEFIFKDIDENTVKIENYVKVMRILDKCVSEKQLKNLLKYGVFHKIDIWKNLIYIIILNKFDDIANLSDDRIVMESVNIYRKFIAIYSNYETKTTTLRNNQGSVVVKQGKENNVLQNELTSKEIQDILLGKKDINLVDIDEDENNVIASQFSQDDLIPVFSHLFIEYKKSNNIVIPSKVLFNECKKILMEGQMFPHISEKYNPKNHSQIIRNYTSNRTFEKYGMAEYNQKTKEYIIY